MTKRLFILATALTLLFLAANVGATDYVFGGDSVYDNVIGFQDSSVYVDTFTTGANAGTLDSGVVWLKANYHGPHSIAIVIYANDSNIVDSTAHFSVPYGGTIDRYSAAFINGGSISASTLYFVGIHAASEGGTNGNYTIAVNSAASRPQGRYRINAADSVIVTPLTGTTTDLSYQKSIFAYYSDGGGGGTTPTKKLGAAKLGNVKL